MTDVDLTAPESPVSNENCHTSTGSMDMYDAYVQRVFQPVGCDDLGDPNNTAQTDFIQFISTTISGRKSIQVLYKLGNGGLTTVWLCRDLETKTYVGLKILIAGASTDDCAELKLAEMGWDTKESGGNRLALQSTIFALTDQMVVIFAWCSRSLDL